MAALFEPFFQAIDGNGNPMSGAKLYFYQTGTSTPQNTFTTSALSVANANPVVADSAGRFPPIYLGTTDYKAVLTDSAGVIQGNGTRDPLLVPTANIITTRGDLIVGNSSNAAARLPIGAADRVLVSSGTDPSWEQINLATSGILSGILGKSKGGAGSAVAAPVSATYTTHTYDAGAVAVPYDDTIPQIGEGIELFSQAYTASTAANRIRVRCVAPLGSSGATVTCMALFIDGAADAVRCVYNRIATAAIEVTTLTWEAALAAGAHTFVIRIGANGGPIAVNGDNATRYGGGVQAAVLTIEELPTS